jgi:signal transduction histidine kinase
MTRIVGSVAAGTARPVTLDVEDDLPEVLADPDKFTQVFMNLVENGVRHGEGEVAVRVRALRPGDDPALSSGVVVIVDDHGEGIPVDLRRRVFTKFWKGGARGGSGLGLYIVGGLTKAHGGTVTIADAPHGGARIIITWPAAPTYGP